MYNNAGAQCKAPLIELTDERLLNCYEVNVFGAVRTIREFSKLLIKSKGLIVFTGSTAGLNPFPFASAYASSKSALHMIASTLAIELTPLGVKVLNIVTGGVSTEIGTNSAYELSDDSFYRIKGKDPFKGNEKARTSTARYSSEDYAKKAVEQVENTMNSSINYTVRYEGTGSSIHRIVSWIPFGRWIVEWMLYKDFNLYAPFQQLKRYYSLEE